MILHIHEPIGETRTKWYAPWKSEPVYNNSIKRMGVDVAKNSLGTFLAGRLDSIHSLQINKESCSDDYWHNYIPQRGDVIDIYLKVGWGWTAAIIAAISLVMNIVAMALAPTPKKPKGAPKDSFGIAGVQNTTGAGTPKFVVYGGPVRIYPHLIGTRIDLGDIATSNGSRRLKFSALYFCGDTGGDGYESMTDIEVNGTKIEDVGGMTYETRLGLDDQTVIPGFETTPQAFNSGITLAQNVAGTYTTKLDNVDRITLIFNQVLYSMSSDGDINAYNMIFKIEKKRHSEIGEEYWVVLENAWEVKARWQAATYYTYTFDTGAPDQWDVRITQTHFVTRTCTDPVLYNVQEEVFTTRNYPGSALLAVFGVSSNQISSFDSLRTSVVMKGKKVNRPLVGGGTELIWTPQRMWIGWDVLTHPRVGLGHRMAPSFFDIGAAAPEQDYLDESVPSQVPNVSEIRDECTLLLNDRKAGWDWIKDSIFGEVNGIIFLSGGKLKPALKRPKTPNLFYSYPGNILEDKGGAIKRTMVQANKNKFNTLHVTIQNRDADYTPDVIEVQDTDIGNDPISDDNIQFDTIKRISQAHRLAQIIIRDNLLVKRRYSFKCGMTAQVSEPFDVDTLGLRSFKEGGQNGHCPPGGSQTSLFLDKAVVLDNVSTYQILLRHQNTNVVERRTATESNGKFFVLTPTSPFEFAPAEGDLWGVGRSGLEHIDVLINDVRRSDVGYELLVSEYKDLVWTLQPLPSKAARRFFNLGNYPPLPLRAVSILENMVLNSSGVYESTIFFDVAPGIPVVSGQITLPVGQMEPIDGAYLGGTVPFGVGYYNNEPPNDDFYTRWTFKITNGPGVGQPEVLITAYDGLTRKVSCDLSTWTQLPTVGSIYEVRKERYGSFQGFSIDMAASPSGPWDEPAGAHFLGTSGRLSGPSLTLASYYRFTPFSNSHVDNLFGRFIVLFQAAGDQLGPDPVQDFNAVQLGADVFFTWKENADVDIACYEIRIGTNVADTWEMAMPLAIVQGSTYKADFVSGVLFPALTQNTGLIPVPIGISNTWPSHPIYSDPIPATAWKIAFIKAVDKSKNVSANAASVTLNILPRSDVVWLATHNELLEPTGEFNGTAYRYINGAPYIGLSAGTGWDLGASWDSGTVYWDVPSSLVGEYTTQPLTTPQLGIAMTRMEVGSSNFNGASCLIQESHSVQTGTKASFTPFKPVTTGEMLLRQAKLKVTLTASSILYDPLISWLKSVIEARYRTVLLSNRFIPAGGLTITHDPAFNYPPSVVVTSYSGLSAVITQNTETTLVLHIGTPGVDSFANIILTGV